MEGKNEVQIQFCFKKGTFSGNDFVRLLDEPNFLGFEPKIINCRDLKINRKKFSRDAHLGKINKLGNSLRVQLESEDFTDSKFGISEVGRSGKLCQVLNWTLTFEQFENVAFDKLLENDNLIVGYIYDVDYVLWESEESISNYDYWQKPYDHLPKSWDHDFNEEKIDISNNPGRMTFVDAFWLISCWRMYYGKEFYDHVSKEKILSFDKANRIEELANEVLLIELYRDVFESDSEENRTLQRQFRDFIDMDDLEEKLSI